MHEPIGGYPELELPPPRPFLHEDGILLNSARNAFRLVLETLKPKRVYVPAYLCSSMREAVEKTGVPYSVYAINRNLAPVEEAQPSANELFVLVNYFGLKACLQPPQEGSSKWRFLMDNAQGYFARPPEDEFAIYSPRKFFGVPDGAVLYGCDPMAEVELSRSCSLDRAGYLLGRIESGPEAFYEGYRAASRHLAQEPPLGMSKLTRRLLSSIDYDEVVKRRRENFDFLHERLALSNSLQFDICDDAVPLVYPYLPKRHGLREYLIQQNIYVAKYWPETFAPIDEESFEVELLRNLAALPIDQRYGCQEMQRIVSSVDSWLVQK